MAGCVAFALLFTTFMPAVALARPLQNQQKEDDQDKKKKDEKPKLSRDEREYQKIKKFSQDLYLKDADFRDEVEKAYVQMQREHSGYAYYINTRDSSDDQVTHTGDKLKVNDTLYDNPLAQDYVNRVGQSLVPSGSKRLYAFKITLNPIPESRALSTGTVYVSSGLLSLIDNEAQLSYILGHEIAHIEKEHWKEDALVAQGAQPYNEKQAKKRAMWGAIAAVAAGSVAGAVTGSSTDAMNVGMMALQFAPTLLKLVVRDAIASWDRLQEDEADQLGLKYMLDRSYDVREVPKLYNSLRRTADVDPRARLGFIADKERLSEREEQVKSLIGSYGNAMQKTLYVGATNLADRRVGKTLDPSRDAAARAQAAEKAISGALSPDIKAKLDAGELIGTSAEFEAVMAGLKRDNGVRAYYYDMFQMARENLEESLRIRSNDPYAHFYYGKVLKLTARSLAEKSRALREFVVAIEMDKRRVLPQAHLYRALAMIETKDPAQMQDIVANLKEYVSLYQRMHGGRLPPDMDSIYDYMQEAGELTWTAVPAINVSTKNIEPIGVSPGAGPRAFGTVSPGDDAGKTAPEATTSGADRKALRGGQRP
ncbi:MAG TPA: M48 family metalloprotease [Pyrinomonadaceae bacterium]|nr:M48 family metalloprotease [Pyrinomonadaceae bacterium]